MGSNDTAILMTPTQSFSISSSGTFSTGALSSTLAAGEEITIRLDATNTSANGFSFDAIRVNVIPEPTSIVTGLGLIGLAISTRQRRRRR